MFISVKVFEIYPNKFVTDGRTSGRTDEQPDGHRQIFIPPPSAKVSSVQHIRLSLRVDYKPYWSDELGELQTVSS